MTDLKGRTALVTGAAGGLGTAFVGALLKAGANVMATDVSAPGLDALAAKISGKGATGALATARLDISNYAACEYAVSAAEKQFGALDILINNGALGMSVIREDHMSNLVGIEEIRPDVWDRFIAVNLTGAWYLTRAAVPGMKARKFGRILTVTTSFFTMLRGKFHPYGPAKAGLEAMAAGHAKEFAGTGITVNVIVPGGPADTAMVPQSSGLKRADLVQPVKMTYPMLWLCSREADTVTGNRYVAANWDERLPPAEARLACEAPIAWPGLATAPVWPGGNPDA